MDSTVTQPVRQRCLDCYRPMSACFCESIPTVDNDTAILILQHRRERFHAFNTARIVHKSLSNSVLLVDHTDRLAERGLPLRPKAGLLYPGGSATLLTDVAPECRPDQLVVIDGTWHHAKTMVRDIPILQTLPRFRLAPTSPGRYRIRREPNAMSLSTVEATVAALRVLEPETANLDELLGAFDKMVESQLAHPNQKQNWRQKSSRRKTAANIPRCILGDLDRLVVAYGEADPAGDPAEYETRWPVSWVAQRLGVGEQFACTIQPRRPLDAKFLRHCQMSAEAFASGIDARGFREKWQRFLRPVDTVIVYSRGTAKLLSNLGVVENRCLALKSVDIGLDRRGKTLDELLAWQDVAVNQPTLPGRAGQRLANLIAWVLYLRCLEASVPNAVII